MGGKNKIWTLVARKLAGEISSDEIQEMNKLIEENPDLHFSIEFILNDWEHSKEADPEQIEKYFQRLQKRLELHKEIKKPLSRNVYLYLSTLIILILSAWLWKSKESSTPEQAPQISFSVPPGERKQYTLPDGSLFWLNSSSELNYEDNGRNRIVHLTGEAYFEVKENLQQPFLINTPLMQIRITGTSLNVKAYPEDLTEETALISGTVSIKHHINNEEFILKPNEKLTLKKNTLVKENHKNNGMVISEKILPEKSDINLYPGDSTVQEILWIKNKLVFENENLEDLVNRFKRWYGVTMMLETDKYNSKRFTGNFELENVNQAIEALKITAGFNYSIYKDTIRIY